ncbi:hypothetical protein E4T42_08557 [Aureobasidium subglaciale]|nr:hypothetical protein E4T42_08557 [Aureobasidium subglaciale]
MAQRGRVVIDLSEDSPPPEPRRSQLRIPDSRFITPSDEDDDNDDSDDSVEVRWTVRQQRHDVGAPKSLNAGQPTKLQNPQPVGQSIKKNATVSFPAKHRPTQLYQPLIPQPTTWPASRPATAHTRRARINNEPIDQAVVCYPVKIADWYTTQLWAEQTDTTT